MAKIKFGMMMTDARGKLGGQVFSKNRAGSYIRTKTTPVNPQTASQMASRQLLGSLSAGWNALTDDAIQAWNQAVDNWKSTDIFGDIKVPTGKNLYTALNKNSLGVGGSPIAFPPDKIELPSLDLSNASIDVSDMEFDVGFTPIPAGVTLQVWATPVLPNGVNYFKNKLRVISTIPAGAVDPTDQWSDYSTRFGPPTAGQRIAIAARYIGSNGQAGVLVNQIVTVQA